MKEFFGLEGIKDQPLFYAYALYKTMERVGTWEEVMDTALTKAKENGVLKEVYETFGTQDEKDLLAYLLSEAQGVTDSEKLKNYILDFYA